MGYRILLLINDKSDTEAIAEAAVAEGHEVVARRSVAEAMAWINTRDHVDVIVSDAYLADESVFDFLKAVKTDDRHNWMQFVIVCSQPSSLSVFLNECVSGAAKVLGADKYIIMDEFCPIRLLKEIKASLPELPPLKDQDPVGDALCIPPPPEKTPNDVNEAQQPKRQRDGKR